VGEYRSPSVTQLLERIFSMVQTGRTSPFFTDPTPKPAPAAPASVHPRDIPTESQELSTATAPSITSGSSYIGVVNGGTCQIFNPGEAVASSVLIAEVIRPKATRGGTWQIKSLFPAEYQLELSAKNKLVEAVFKLTQLFGKYVLAKPSPLDGQPINFKDGDRLLVKKMNGPISIVLRLNIDNGSLSLTPLPTESLIQTLPMVHDTKK
jgi:hypothetical protein